MALIHKAQISPTKLELLASWLPTRPWYDGPAEPEPARVAAGRFDDPDGEVGIETIMVSVGPVVLHVPLTYRGAPLPGAEAWLVGTLEHSVLGTRWVYDGAGDPVYAAQLAETIRSGGHEAIEEFETDGQRVTRESDLKLAGSGADVAPLGEVGSVRDGEPTVITASGGVLTVNRVPTVAVDPAAAGVLTACWSGQETPVVVAHLSPRAQR